MKLRVTMEFPVKETERGFAVMDDDGMNLCIGTTLQDAVDELRQMIDSTALINEIAIDVVEVIPTDAAGYPKGELPPAYTPPKYRGDA